MSSEQELITQYFGYSDEELYNILVNIEGYSPEAKHALTYVIEKKGGTEALKLRLVEGAELEKERSRIVEEINALGKNGVDKEFVTTMIQSNVLSREELDQLIDDTYRRTQVEAADRRIKPRTIIGSVIGIILSTLIGGLVTGFARYQIGATQLPVIIIVLLLFALAFLCGVIVKLCAGASLKNPVVRVATGISVILAISLSETLFIWFFAIFIYQR